MAPRERLRAMAEEADTLVYAFDPFGATGVSLPPTISVDAARVLEHERPLELLDPETHGVAVTAFEHARRDGHGAALVRFVDDATARWVDIFDVLDEHGCFVAVFSPHDPTDEIERPVSALAPRRAPFVLDADGVIQAISADFTAMLGWTEDDVLGTSALQLVHPDDHEASIVAWVELLHRPGASTRLRQRVRCADGSWLWCESTDHNDLDDPDEPRLFTELIDISREVVAEQELQRREAILDRLYRALPSGVLVLDAQGHVAVRNERWPELVGATSERPLDALYDSLVDAAPVRHAVRIATQDGVDSDLHVEFAPGAPWAPFRFAELHVRPLFEAGRPAGLLMTLDDQTDRRLHDIELANQMRHDQLTGVLNRGGVEQELGARLARVDTPPMSVLYLDLDEFKSVNDRFGHAAGDELLCAVVDRVGESLGPADAIGRLGGDEFLVLVDGEPTVADRMAADIQAGVDRLADEMTLIPEFGLSIGVAHRHPGDDFDSLIRRADASMYESKRQRRLSSGRDRRQPGPSR